MMTMGGKVIQTITGDDGSPYLTRVVIGHLRLHIFHRGDSDDDCHDHPADFWTFPLTAYVEEVDGLRADLEVRVVRAFRLHFRPAEYTHRVVGRWSGHLRRHPQQRAEDITEPGRIVTIAWFGPKRRDWGFLKRRDGTSCWVDWKNYIFHGGKTAPCA